MLPSGRHAYSESDHRRLVVYSLLFGSIPLSPFLTCQFNLPFFDMPLFRRTVDLWHHKIDLVPSASVRARRIVAMLSTAVSSALALRSTYPGSRARRVCSSVQSVQHYPQGRRPWSAWLHLCCAYFLLFPPFQIKRYFIYNFCYILIYTLLLDI
jgi:hypothetical protein